VGPRASLDTEARGKIFCLRRGSNLDRPVVQPVARYYIRPGQTFADQELILIFTETRGPPHILIFLVVYGKTQEIYNNNNNNILILIIRCK
jgi:hypothetical protein